MYVRRVLKNFNIDWELSILLILPLFLFLINQHTLFPIDGIDPWFYLGYFLELPQHLKSFPDTYYGTRLSWILPGFLAYQLFTPLVAAFVLHLVFYYAAIISLYLILRFTIDRRVALLASVLMGCYCYFFVAIGSNYVDGAGLTYFLLILLMLTQVKWFRLQLCMAGVFSACLVYTNLFLVNFLPFIALYYLFMNCRYKHSLLQSFIFFVGGFLGLTLVFCIINYCLGGRFFFFFPAVRWAYDFVHGPNVWFLPISVKMLKQKQMTWLILPALTFLMGVIVLIFHRITQSLPARRYIIFFQIYFILLMSLYIFWHLVEKQPVLELCYYSSYLMPSLFLAIGSQLAIALNQMDKRQFYVIFIITIAISGLTLLPFSWQWSGLHIFFQVFLIGLMAIFVIVKLCMAITLRFRRGTAAFLIVMLLMTINAVIVFNPWGESIFQFDQATLRNAYRAVVKNIQLAHQLDPTETALFWYQVHTKHRELGLVYLEVVSGYLWGYRLVNEEFPQLTEKQLTEIGKPSQPQFTEHQRIFIFSTDRRAVAMANRSLARIGFKADLIGQRDMRFGSISYTNTLVELHRLAH